MQPKHSLKNKLNGVALVFIFASSATFVANLDIIKASGISPIIIGLIFGLFFGSSLRHKLPASFNEGILFSTKTILRIGVALYGFRITLNELLGLGIGGLFLDLIIVVSTIFVGLYVGEKLFKLDRDQSLLNAFGSAICGAAAVLATESVLKSKHDKSVVAVAGVVIFGTISMFLYPMIYNSGLLALNQNQIGIFLGATVHEVAHVIGAGSAISTEVTAQAVISKMARVFLMIPALLVLVFLIYRGQKSDAKLPIPYFGLWFIGFVVLNSYILIPKEILENIWTLDTFLLTMAMSALGMETNWKKVKDIGIKPFLHALFLFVWLFVAGFVLVKVLV